MTRKKNPCPVLTQRNSIFYVSEYNPETKTVEKLSLKTRNPSVAREKFAIYLREGKKAFEDKNFITVPQALNDYYAEHVIIHVVSCNTVRNNILNLKKFFDSKKTVITVCPDDCSSYVNFRAAAGACHSTAAKELATLRAAIWHAQRQKRVNLAEMPNIRIPKPPQKKSTIWLFEDEILKLFEAADKLRQEPIFHRTLGFVSIAYYTGARKTSVEQLKWKQVDLQKQRINFLFDGEQTAKKRVVVPIDKRLRPIIEELYENRISEYVLGVNSCARYGLLKAAKLAGLSQVEERDGRPSGPITCHMLRHSRVTHLLEKGKPLWSVAALIGNSTSTTERVYGHKSADYLENLFD